MSTVNEIRQKKVDFYIYSNINDVLNSVNTEQDHGKLNVVVDDNNVDNNALYVGDTHIASGWGFSTISTLREVEELISNENIQKVIADDFSIIQNITYNITADTTSTGGGSAISEVPLYINGNKIYVENGLLKGESFINIYNTSTINGFYLGEIINHNIENEFTIHNISLDYDILDTNNTLFYNIKYKKNTDEVFTPVLDSQTVTVEADGIKHTRLPLNLNQTVDINSIINENGSLGKYTLDFFIEFFNNDDENPKTCMFKLCTVNINKCNVYITANENERGTNKKELEKDKTAELSITLGSDSYVYVWLPTTFTNDTTYPVIYKKSDIAGLFSNSGLGTKVYDNITYKIYKSPQQYIGGTTWLIK